MTKSKMWSPTDPKHFEGKTTKELQDSLVRAEAFAKAHPKFQFGWHNEYRQELKKYIAERIGREKNSI